MNKWNIALKQSSVSDFTRDEFLAYVTTFFNSEWAGEAERDAHARHFSKIVSPDVRGYDLIYWPEVGAEDTPEGVVGRVEKFRRENGLPGFREEGSPEPDTAK